jgi:MerR family transcriptional regulator, copper efflux regulator
MSTTSLRIGEVARRAGVTVDAVRFYERRGVLPPAQRQLSGYRSYTDATVERIRLTKSLQALGFTLEEVVDALGRLDTADATCASERWRFEQVLDRIDTKLAELRRVRRDVVRVLTSTHAGHCEICDGSFR